MEMVIEAGYRPGFIGLVSALQARYYAHEWGFGSAFEVKITREMCLLGSITLDGSDAQNPSRTAHLRWFIIDSSSRGCGLGRRLINRALTFARETGNEYVYLWTFDGLHAARKLYDEAGFELVEQQIGTKWTHT